MIGRWASIVAGVWLVLAPWLLGYTDLSARTNDVWMGLAMIAVAITAIRVPGFRFVNSGLGAWLVMAPWVLSYNTPQPVVNDVIVGLAVLAFSMVPQVRFRDIRRRASVTA
ncbi:MAG: SPW repeat protein [Myxococcaceae bacterium]